MKLFEYFICISYENLNNLRKSKNVNYNLK